ncbi:hypothetical protein FOB63_001942 [Clavispora lusitaniae]|nr:hypothetical protein FOB63_001942 [Clavispora lusitaniae]
MAAAKGMSLCDRGNAATTFVEQESVSFPLWKRNITTGGARVVHGCRRGSLKQLPEEEILEGKFCKGKA